MQALGGPRRAHKNSPNAGWWNQSFRGYADYMQTKEFQSALNALIDMSRNKTCRDHVCRSGAVAMSSFSGCRRAQCARRAGSRDSIGEHLSDA